MSPSLPLTPIQFLSAGNLVTAGLQLYRHHFKTYLRLSTSAQGWLLLSIVSAILTFIPANLLPFDLSFAWNILFRLVWLGLALFGLAKYQATSGALARLCFQQLLHQPETPQSALHYANDRLSGFWWISILTAVLFAAIFIGLYVLLAIAFGVFFVAVGGTAFLQNATGVDNSTVIATSIAVFGGMLLISGIPALLFLLWFSARFMIPEMTYAVEPEATPTESIGQGWNLTRYSGWRLVLVLTSVLTVLFPLQVFYQVVNTILQGGLASINPSQTSLLFLTSLLLGQLLNLLFNCLMLPIWQAVKATVYYDLRSRREGMGLELLENQETLLADASSTAPPTRSVMELFNTVKLLTPESVELEFTLAGIGNRALALVIDYGILAIGLLLFWVLWLLFAFQLVNYLEATGVNYSNVPLWLLAIGSLASFVFSTGYFAGFEVLRQGQTPGKRFTKIRVIRDDGRPVGLQQAILRSLLQSIDYILFIGAFMIVLGKQEKRIGDWAAGTLVIQENRAMQQAIDLSDSAKQLATELPQTTDLNQLQPQHFAVISEYLQRRSFMDYQARSDLSLNLARQVRAIVHLETVPEGLSSDVFLEAVYLAYQEQFAGY